MNCLLYYTSPPKTTQFSPAVKTRRNQKFDVIMVNLDEDVIGTGTSLYTVIWTGWPTKTNRKNNKHKV